MTSDNIRRQTITGNSDWFDRYKEQARKEGASLSEWMTEKCNKALTVKARNKLSERVHRGRPRNQEDEC